MRISYCPECGEQHLEQRRQTAFFHCPMCESTWVIVDTAVVTRLTGTPTLYGALGTFHQDDVIGPTKLNTIDKGVSL